uniref:ARAD1C45694p n=1 Tax=Blastobotrys adeninivorans TaxID=409370 RepID=A0A060T9L4_BLAAD
MLIQRTLLRSQLIKTCPKPSAFLLSQKCFSTFGYLQQSCCGSSQSTTPKQNKSMLSASFWSSTNGWKRASVNTFRCLIGCTSGDFSAMWMLQSFYPGLPVSSTMAISMLAGISTSLLLETVLLRMGKDKLSWANAFKTAAGMSLVSMLAMEAAENLVDYHFTGGIVSLDDPQFWIAAAIATGAGFLAPLPYNYARLVKFGKSCH